MKTGKGDDEDDGRGRGRQGQVIGQDDKGEVSVT